jgi:hypothetical protein
MSEYEKSCLHYQRSLIMVDLDHAIPLDLDHEGLVDLVLLLDLAQLYMGLILILG